MKISAAPFLLLKIPSLKIKSSLRKEIFEANLKSECDLWSLMVKEMWAGRRMADDHKVGRPWVLVNGTNEIVFLPSNDTELTLCVNAIIF